MSRRHLDRILPALLALTSAHPARAGCGIGIPDSTELGHFIGRLFIAIVAAPPALLVIMGAAAAANAYRHRSSVARDAEESERVRPDRPLP